MKSKYLLSLTVASGLVLLSQHAFAIGANQGFYLAGQLGAAFNDYPDVNSPTSTVIREEKNEFTWGVTGGFNFSVSQYQRMNQFVFEDQDGPSGQTDGSWLVGASMGVMGLGNTKYTQGSDSEKLTNYSINFLVNMTYAYQGYYIWGETGLGVGITDGKASSNFSPSKSHTNGVYILGGGVGYSWHYWNIFFRYDHYFGKTYPSSIALQNAAVAFPAMDVFLGGIAYTF